MRVPPDAAEVSLDAGVPKAVTEPGAPERQT